LVNAGLGYASYGVDLLKQIVGMYIRMEWVEIERLRDHPEILPKYDPRVPLADGRAIDIGRAWEELGVFIDGGVKCPEVGPTVGDVPMNGEDSRAMWSYVEPERVVAMAAELKQMRRKSVRQQYHVDLEDTQTLPGARTGAWGDRAAYVYNKLRALTKHYQAAADAGQGMLVRIGERF
jgi:Domain of unknown function (DUF1877)